MLAIETTGLTKRFGRRAVVDGVGLRVPLGCAYGFLGPNGAGKSTTMRLLLGLLRADAGSIRLIGQDLHDERKRALTGVGALVESPSLYEHLSGRTNLDLTGRLLALPAGETDRVLDIVDLRGAAGVRVRDYSLGMRQRLALARALLGTPRLLLLDEPTNGLDPDGIIAMRALIRSLPDRIGGTVFVSSHLLSEVEQVADHAGVMRAGRLVLQNTVRSMLGDGTVVALTVDRAEAGTALLRSAGLDARTRDDRTVHLHCRDAHQAQTAAANRMLVTEGFAVAAMVPQTRTLEDVYRETLASTPGLEGEAG